jgi:ATP-dependent DNA helicase RecG
MAFDLHLANIARDGALIEHVREIAKGIIADDPELVLPQNVLMARMLSRLKKSEYDWSSIS